MSAEFDAHKVQLATTKAAMLAAMQLIDRLAQATPDPAGMVTETSNLKSVTEALMDKVAQYQSPGQGQGQGRGQGHGSIPTLTESVPAGD
jgi:hypothetical protein